MGGAVHRNPDISDWVKTIDPILVAAGQPVIGSDKVENISVTDIVSITISYTVRGCQEDTTVKIPVGILQANDPVQAAKVHKLERAIATAKRRVAEAQRSVEVWQSQVRQLEKELAQFGEGNG